MQFCFLWHAFLTNELFSHSFFLSLLCREEQSMTGETAVVSGWEGVVNLIELDPSKSEGKDLSKMRQLLITLKHKGN